MYRDFFTSKWVLGGFAFLILFGIACILWYHYDTAPYKRDVAKTAELLRQIAANKPAPENKVAKGTDAPAQNSKSTTERTSTQVVPGPDTSSQTETKEYKVGDIYVGKTPPPIPVPQDQLVSPYGFGPYPELPKGYGPITWPRRSVESELMIRVEVKLMNQGIPVEGIAMENGLVYPIIKGICYVEWGETSYGRRYLRSSTGHPDDGDYMERIEEERRKRRESVTASDFPGIILMSYEEGGIDPYTFLDLPK